MYEAGLHRITMGTNRNIIFYCVSMVNLCVVMCNYSRKFQFL